jgi:hypothetical protein
MPSAAFKAFEYNLVDPQRMIGTFKSIKKQGAGQGHLTRGGIMLLCAAWELYVEMVIRECAAVYTAELALPTELPLAVQQEISRAVKSDKHDLRPLDLAGTGWKSFYSSHVERRADNLNTPKSNKLAPLFQELVGVSDITTAWSAGPTDLDAFVSVRGDIAHKGRHADYMKIGDVESYNSQIRLYAVETDNFLSDHLKSTTPTGYKPWNKTK